MVPRTRFERVAFPLGGGRSIQLSYRGKLEGRILTLWGGVSLTLPQQATDRPTGGAAYASPSPPQNVATVSTAVAPLYAVWRLYGQGTGHPPLQRGSG